MKKIKKILLYFQHLNSGVVLQDLEKIRENKNLQELFSPIFMNKIVQYLNIPTWGDQVNFINAMLLASELCLF